MYMAGPNFISLHNLSLFSISPHNKNHYCRMTCLPAREALVILLFNIVVPSMDQYTDITIILRLMAGPEPDTHLHTGRLWVGG